MKTNNKQEEGFIKIILIIIIVVVILSVLNIDIRGLVESESFQNNFSYLREAGSSIWSWLVQVWGTYLKEPVTAFVGYIQKMLEK